MNKLKEIRKNQHLRQIDLASKSDISLSWIWIAENGGKIGYKAKEKISKALGIPVKEIFPK